MVEGVSPGHYPSGWLDADDWFPAESSNADSRCETQTRAIADERFHGGLPIQLVTIARWQDDRGSAVRFIIPDSGPGGALFASSACEVMGYGTPIYPPPRLERPGDSAQLFQLHIDCHPYWRDPVCGGGKPQRQRWQVRDSGGRGERRLRTGTARGHRRPERRHQVTVLVFRDPRNGQDILTGEDIDEALRESHERFLAERRTRLAAEARAEIAAARAERAEAARSRAEAEMARYKSLLKETQRP